MCVLLAQYQYFIFKTHVERSHHCCCCYHLCFLGGMTNQNVCYQSESDIFLVSLSFQSVSWLSVGEFPLCVGPLYASLWSQRQRHLHWRRTSGGFQISPHLQRPISHHTFYGFSVKKLIICLNWQHAGTNGCTLSNFQVAPRTMQSSQYSRELWHEADRQQLVSVE